MSSGWQTFDLDVGIVLETRLGELQAAFGIGASCSFYSQLGSFTPFEKGTYLRCPDASLKNCVQELNYIGVCSQCMDSLVFECNLLLVLL